VMAGNATQAAEFINQPIDLVISDLRLSHEDGLDLLAHWAKHHPEVPFIIVTAYGEVSSAVAAMKLGAADYLTKPLQPDELLHLIRQHLPPSVSSSQEAAQSASGFEGMIGRSAVMRDVHERIRRVASSDSIVLITGESGTGKELVASAIHRHSARREHPFLAVNITALPEGLVEGELFGYVKGAFTGAFEDRKGKFEAADGGTLFIDEVGDFPLALQPKLLRVLEGFQICPVGAHYERPVNVRVVTATSRNLGELVAAGTFRSDLYYRLNVLTIHLPPLRERREDIPLLIEYFLSESARRHGLQPPTLAPELLHYLESYEWPGNIRQLRNALENMIVMGRDTTLTLNDLPSYFSGSPIAQAVNTATDANLQDLERIAILSALDRCQGNRTRAADVLGISVRTLQRKLKQWGLMSGDA
jgi:DNA-binding NtrC family response regulator